VRRPRFVQRWWAWLRGYFWEPCPLCGQYFSGAEWADSGYATIPTGEPGKGRGICTDCWQKGLAVPTVPIVLRGFGHGTGTASDQPKRTDS
jgi:hypothetical protein